MEEMRRIECGGIVPPLLLHEEAGAVYNHYHGYQSSQDGNEHYNYPLLPCQQYPLKVRPYGIWLHCGGI